MAEALNLVKGSGIELTKDTANNTLTISVTGSGNTGLDYIKCSEDSSGNILYPTTNDAYVLIYSKQLTGQYGGGSNTSLFVKTFTFTNTDKTTHITTTTGTYTLVVGNAAYSEIKYSTDGTTTTWSTTPKT